MTNKRKLRNLNRNEITLIQRELGKDYSPLVSRTVDTIFDVINEIRLNRIIEDSVKDFLIETIAYCIATDSKLKFLTKYIKEKENEK